MPHDRTGHSPLSQQQRRAIRDSGESLRVLARRFGVNPKTVAKWKGRASSADLPRGPKPGQHGSLSAEEEGIIVRFREHTLLPLDDCLYALQARIPHLSRSSLHRCLKRHGISRLPAGGEADAAGHSLHASGLGDVHIDRSMVRSHDGQHYMFNAIEQASKFVFVSMGERCDGAAAAEFLATTVQRSPFSIRRVFTLAAEPFVVAGGEGAFGLACKQLGIEHCLSLSPDPWVRRSEVRIGRMVQDTVTFASEAYLASLLDDFVDAYNFRRRLKTLRGKTPYEFLCQAWQKMPERFLRDPHHDLVGLKIVRV